MWVPIIDSTMDVLALLTTQPQHQQCVCVRRIPFVPLQEKFDWNESCSIDAICSCKLNVLLTDASFARG